VGHSHLACRFWPLRGAPPPLFVREGSAAPRWGRSAAGPRL
jgi:hypothetical protein